MLALGTGFRVRPALNSWVVPYLAVGGLVPWAVTRHFHPGLLLCEVGIIPQTFWGRGWRLSEGSSPQHAPRAPGELKPSELGIITTSPSCYSTADLTRRGHH